MASTPSYAPKGTKATAFAYWWPTDGRGPIDNDTLAIVRGAKNPVLAHLFLNHVLDVKQAFSNYSYIFYQQPLSAMTPPAVVKQGLVPANLQTTLIEEDQFRQGYVQGPLSTRGRDTVGERLGGGEVDVSAGTVDRHRSGYWRTFALPGVVWLFLFVVVPAYALLAIALGRVNFLFQPVPYWNPLHWNPGYVSQAFSGALPGGEYWPAVRNTLVYVAVSLALCFAIGYPVAYYVARHAKRSKTLLIVLLVIPFWVSYLLRMLAWIGLLVPGRLRQPDPRRWIGITHPPDWLNGNAYSVILALVYGYIPYFILPVFAGLDRIDRSQIEAARDLGATPFQAFMQVTLPLSRPSILAGSALVVLPMFGDYYTNDLISGSPHTNMLGNEINLFVQGGSQKNLGASLVLVLMVIMAVGMAYYLFQTARDTRNLATA